MGNQFYKHILIVSLGSMVISPNISVGALIDRGGGLVYDSDQDITWLMDANYSQTSGYDTNGRMTWSEATDWAATLNYYDSVRGVTYNDWRLPATLVPDPSCDFPSSAIGFDCSGSEMGYLYYVYFGGLSEAPNPLDNTPPLTDADVAPFINLLPDPWAARLYWSSTLSSASSAYSFEFMGVDQGRQIDWPVHFEFMTAWAVREGDVVPVPAAAWLFGSGLLGLIAVSRSRRNTKPAGTH